MAIKTAQANYDNGTTYDVLHYETQVKQVKVLDPNGNVTGDLQGKLDSINSDITVVDAKTINNATDISGLKQVLELQAPLQQLLKQLYLQLMR